MMASLRSMKMDGMLPKSKKRQCLIFLDRFIGCIRNVNNHPLLSISYTKCVFCVKCVKNIIATNDDMWYNFMVTYELHSDAT